jgi:DNA-binding transcriptional MerR regulator
VARRAGRKLFYKIGEVCEICGVEPHVLRYWESEFPTLSPGKNRAGQRIFRSKDLELIDAISRLLYEEGYTIAGARKKLGDRTAGAGLPLFKKKDLSYRKVCLEVRKELESLADHLRKDLSG